MFDVDGTLLDSRGAIAASYREATRAVLARELPATDAESHRMLQSRAVDVFAKLAGGDRRVERELALAYDRAYERRRPGVSAFPGARELLEALRSIGLRLALVTSKSRSRLDGDLDRTGLRDLVDATVAGDEVQHGKPHPEPLLAGLAALGVSPDAALYVGDAPVDIAAARAAGVRSVGVAFESHAAALRGAAPDLLIQNYDDLLAVLGRELEGHARDRR